MPHKSTCDVTNLDKFKEEFLLLYFTILCDRYNPTNETFDVWGDEHKKDITGYNILWINLFIKYIHTIKGCYTKEQINDDIVKPFISATPPYQI
jgi:hypothetical protein